MERRAVTYDGVEFTPGRQYVVVGLGAYLSGMRPLAANSWGGWRQELHPGDIITCTGFGPGWGSDPGYGVEWSSQRAMAEHIIHVDFHPMTGGAWAYHPFPGYLRPHHEEVS